MKWDFTDRAFGDVRKWELPELAEHFGVTKFVGMRQVHGNGVYVVDEVTVDREYASFADFPEADAIVTTVPKIGIGVQVADCVPILLVGFPSIKPVKGTDSLAADCTADVYLAADCTAGVSLAADCCACSCCCCSKPVKGTVSLAADCTADVSLLDGSVDHVPLQDGLTVDFAADDSLRVASTAVASLVNTSADHVSLAHTSPDHVSLTDASFLDACEANASFTDNAVTGDCAHTADVMTATWLHVFGEQNRVGSTDNDAVVNGSAAVMTAAIPAVVSLGADNVSVVDGSDCCCGLTDGGTQNCVPTVTAAVHAGRVGLECGVIEAAVQRMRDVGARYLFGTIGPHIGVANYEVPQSMQDDWKSQGRAVGQTSWGTPSLDLHKEALRQLSLCNVFVHPDLQSICTKDAADTYFSYRATAQDGLEDGRQIGFICL